MRKRCSILGAALFASLAFPALAEARIIDLRLSGNGSVMYGWGTTTGTQDMFRQAAGPGFGAEAGLKLLVFDVSLNVMQIVKSSGLSATLIQGLIGTDIDIPVGHSKLDNGQSAHMLHTGLVAGFVLGTRATATLPVMNDELADKGFVTRYRFAYEYFLNPFMGIGGEGQFGYHYLLGGQAVNNTSTHSTGYQIAALASFIFHLGY
jgi:hypothetical protein